ncbi:unnamed protein product [Rhizoctonia solani]|uniref:Uncharacterized protein n=1 Tax=Rhizoctonia solani TaxID=456999 RepID=A0A8H3BSJ5_9AGAM|nr:unnamed protein product [Rhizoctonia solani]
MSEHACSHLVDAMNKKGKLTFDQLPRNLARPKNMSKKVVFTGKTKPDEDEFNKILKVLGISEQPPHDGAHAPKS